VGGGEYADCLQILWRGGGVYFEVFICRGCGGCVGVCVKLRAANGKCLDTYYRQEIFSTDRHNPKMRVSKVLECVLLKFSLRTIACQ